MDPAVTGRFDIRGLSNPARPVIHKLVLLGITPEAHGNAIELMTELQRDLQAWIAAYEAAHVFMGES